MLPSVPIIESGSFLHSILVVKRRRIESNPGVKDAGVQARVIPITPFQITILLCR